MASPYFFDSVDDVLIVMNAFPGVQHSPIPCIREDISSVTRCSGADPGVDAYAWDLAKRYGDSLLDLQHRRAGHRHGKQGFAIFLAGDEFASSFRGLMPRRSK